MQVPFVDLTAQYNSIKDEIDGAIAGIINHASFVGGAPLRDFESAFAQCLGVAHCVGCGNGTDSMEIILEALGVGAGDEVIVPANSWFSTSEVVSRVGATPVFADVEPDYYTISVADVAAKITPRTKAVIPVHLYGQAADMPALMPLAHEHKLHVIEDCAQAHLAAINGQYVGTFGIAASFSFYPGKNLGAYGDAGCMLTNDDALAQKLRMIANHGQQGKHNHLIEGRNSRLDSLQAAILHTKLPHLQKWTEQRIANAASYTALLGDQEGIVTPPTKAGYQHVFHLYVVRVLNREAMLQHLRDAGVQASVHYPTALPLLPAYKQMGHVPEDFPVASVYQSQILSLPMFAELSEAQIQAVATAVKTCT